MSKLIGIAILLLAFGVSGCDAAPPKLGDAASVSAASPSMTITATQAITVTDAVSPVVDVPGFPLSTIEDGKTVVQIVCADDKVIDYSSKTVGATTEPISPLDCKGITEFKTVKILIWGTDKMYKGECSSCSAYFLTTDGGQFGKVFLLIGYIQMERRGAHPYLVYRVESIH